MNIAVSPILADPDKNNCAEQMHDSHPSGRIRPLDQSEVVRTVGCSCPDGQNWEDCNMSNGRFSGESVILPRQHRAPASFHATVPRRRRSDVDLRGVEGGDEMRCHTLHDNHFFYCCLPNFGRCDRSQDRVSVNCPLVEQLYPAEWMAEKLFRTVDHPS